MLRRVGISLVLLMIWVMAGCHGGGASAPASSVTTLGLEYAQTPVSYTVGQPVPENVPTYEGPADPNYSVEPALPSGLSLDSRTGIISGTPTAASNWQNYVVTAAADVGQVQAIVRIEVTQAPPPPVINLSYSQPSAVYVVGKPIEPNRPHSSGAPVLHYLISPSLPDGLTFSAQTGVISGTPKTVSGPQHYTVTAQGGATSTSQPAPIGVATLTISVEDPVQPLPAPTNLHYTHTWAVYSVGKPIPVNDAHHDGGEIARYWAATPLPAGLHVNETTGGIEGTPTAATDASGGTYTILGNGPGGSASTSVQIVVAAPGTWVPAPGTMASPRYGFAQVALPDGRILVAGGKAYPGSAPIDMLDTAEIYDPDTGTFSPAGQMSTPRYGAMAQLLPDGRVLIVGGAGSSGALATAELFDPSALESDSQGRSPWQPAGSLSVARTAAAIALAHDDPDPSRWHVVVAGGNDSNQNVLQSTELFDVRTGTWSLGQNLSSKRTFASALAMQDGAQIVVPGGTDGTSQLRPIAQINTYPAAAQWQVVRLSNGARYQYGSFVVSPNTAVIFGGIDASLDSLKTIDQYDASTRTWSPFPVSLAVGRSAPLVAPLDGNSVLIAGGKAGRASGVGIKDAEILTVQPLSSPPSTDVATSPMNEVRVEGGASELPDGHVLAVGGWDNTAAGPNVSDTAEIYVP